MASDEDYAAFLDKANQDAGASNPSVQAKSVGTKAVNTEVPQALQQVEEYYTSEADEPFEPVSLKWAGDKIPSEKEFSELVQHSGDVAAIDEKDFDPRGQYKQVISAVKQAGSSEVQIFRVELGRVRAEYYVVSLDSEAGRLVGLKAIAIES